MVRSELVGKLAEAIAQYEGFYMTEEVARNLGKRWPTMAQRHSNPGNIRQWRDAHNQPYPQANGYVDFVAWARQFPLSPDATNDHNAAALAEGWRVLRVLVGRYIDGKYHSKQSPTLLQFFEKYAPSADSNYPEKYARFVAETCGLAVDVPLIGYIDASV